MSVNLVERNYYLLGGEIKSGSTCRRAIVIALSAVTTAAATAFVTLDGVELTDAAITNANFPRLAEIAVLYGLFYIMIYCNLIYQLANFGHFTRQCRLSSVGRTDLESIYDREAVRELLILIPSYKEEEEVIRQSLVSAALVKYPRRRVVLLIDDPPTPASSADAERLLRSRRLPGELQALFAGPAARFEAERSTYHQRQRRGHSDADTEARRLACLYTEAAIWLEQEADRFEENKAADLTHTDQLFIRKILLEPAAAHRRLAAELTHQPPEPERIAREYRRLASLFSVEFGSFERKLYANLSHVPNKAMNLNSYIYLVGKSFREVVRDGARHLEQCDESVATLTIPASDDIATVDADSLITSE
jgi:cellulose synthase (UDP-forming)